MLLGVHSSLCSTNSCKVYYNSGSVQIQYATLLLLLKQKRSYNLNHERSYNLNHENTFLKGVETPSGSQKSSRGRPWRHPSPHCVTLCVENNSDVNKAWDTALEDKASVHQ